MMKGVDGVGGKGCQEVDEGEAHLFELNVVACDGAVGALALLDSNDSQ